MASRRWDGIEDHLDLVRRVVFSMSVPQHIDRDDMMQDGALGLMRAWESFDPNGGASFQTYARKVIRGAILDCLRSWRWGSGSRDRVRLVERAKERAERKLNREPGIDEISEEARLTPDRVSRILALPADMLEMPHCEDGSAVEFCDSTADDALLMLIRDRDRRMVREAICRLPEQERDAVVKHYIDELPLSEVAKQLGVTEKRVSQLHRSALKHLEQRSGWTLQRAFRMAAREVRL